MRHAYGYVRVSGDGQLDGHGLTRQCEAITAYAKAHDLEIVQVFEDGGVSGTTDLADRPGLKALLQAMATDGVRILVVEALDRLARDLMVQELILADLRTLGAELVSTREGEDLAGDDPTRQLVRQIMGAIAQWDKSNLVRRLRSARGAARTKNGKCEGRKGYADSPDPGDRAVADLIGSLRERGMSYGKIAAHLNDSSRPPRGGGRWAASTVRSVLKSLERLGRK
jgi:DNA invertase Pin-like site-specific DNA recombinase